jgi:Reverse transcriptase (RNA-dependent DNA polymerase)
MMTYSNIVAVLAVWYSEQGICIQWKNVLSCKFRICNGTRQGEILSPYLFARYIRELIAVIVQANIGCNIGGAFCNIFAYADDLVLLAPSWKAMQSLIKLLSQCAQNIEMTCNAATTVCMVCNHKCRRMIIASEFFNVTFCGAERKFMSEFKYLGHVIDHELSDDKDVKREIRNLFMRGNILI